MSSTTIDMPRRAIAQPAENATAEMFKAGMRKLASGVALITTGLDGTRAGLIATAINSVSAEPPTLLVCVNKNASAHLVIDASGSMCINLLSGADLALVEAFSTPSRREERFKAGEWDELPSGVPRLCSALAAFDCMVVDRLSYQTHTIFIGQVRMVYVDEERVYPLLYLDRTFRKLQE